MVSLCHGTQLTQDVKRVIVDISKQPMFFLEENIVYK